MMGEQNIKFWLNSLLSNVLWKPISLPKFPLIGNFSASFKGTALLFQSFLAAIIGFCFYSLHFPVSWLLGGIAAGIIWVFLKDGSQPLPSSLGNVGQGIIAVATATRFSLQSLSIAGHYFLPLLICIGVTGGMSLLNGYFLWWWAGIDKKTGFLGSIPGASASIIAMSEEMGADGMMVAILQSLRVCLVAIIVPLLVGFFFPVTPSSLPETPLPTVSASLPWMLSLPLIGFCGGIGIIGGKKLGLPSATFLGPFLVSLIAFWRVSFTVPEPVFIIGLGLVGLSIGLKFDVTIVKTLFKAVLIEFLLILLLILSCLGAGYLFHLITHVDLVTAILGSTPGGISAMMATVINLQGDAGLVMVMQMTRMLLILLLAPLLSNMLKDSP